MCFKLAGTIMQRRIDYETEMAERASASDEALENQDFGEFVEDRFMEMYGIKKVAHENLRDFVKTLKDCSGNHIRLKTFRILTGIVPGDDAADYSVSDDCAAFYRLALRLIMETATSDHMIKMKGSAFWSHYAKSDAVRLSVLYFEKVTEKLQKRANVKTDKTAKQEAFEIRALRSFEASLNDFAEGKLADTPDVPDKDGNRAKVFEYGDANLSRASTRGVKTATRIDVDCFLDKCCEHWTLFEILEEDQLVQAFSSWDANGDGKLELDEFTKMVTFANPNVKQQKITRAFLAASGTSDYVDKARLATALLANGLTLCDKPVDGVDMPPGPPAEGTDDTTATESLVETT